MSEYKGYNIIGDGTFGYQKIKTIGAGKLPVSLGGSYTSPIMAQRQIDTYLLTKEKKDGKTKGDAGG